MTVQKAERWPHSTLSIPSTLSAARHKCAEQKVLWESVGVLLFVVNIIR